MVVQPVYVDANIFVYWLGDHPDFGKTAYDWVRKIEDSSRGEYITSSLTVYETLVVMAGLTGKTLKDSHFAGEVVKSISQLQGLRIEPLQAEDFAESTELMSSCQLDFEDALHLAVALRVKAKLIVTNDKDFDKTPIEGTI
jgi:predicted nucleic acid-binding protein